MEETMHNLLPFNQLAEWRHIEKSLDALDEANEQLEQLNDYYDCLIECDDSQHMCKRICKEILTQ